MANRSFLAVCVLAALSVSACETVQSDINHSWNSTTSTIKQAFSNFRPFDENATTQNAQAPADDLSPVTSLADTTIEQTPLTDPNASKKVAAKTDKSNKKEAPKPEKLAAASAPSSSSGCPLVRIVQDLNQVHQFTDASNPTPSGSISSVRMQSISTKCSTLKNNMAIDMTVAFDGSLGPKARAQTGDKPSFAYPYFVAITNNQGSIIAKEVFAVTLAYNGGKNRETHTEQIRQLIPLKDRDFKNYKVLIGFQLTDQELAFNRTVADNPSAIEPAAGGN